MKNNIWRDILPPESTKETLLELEKSFYPKSIMSVEKNSFNNPFLDGPAFTGLTRHIGMELSSSQIDQFSKFTIETFYEFHSGKYNPLDIEVFKSQQELFFSLPFHYVRHEMNGLIVAYSVTCLLEDHPFFEEPTWHIGYWGIHKALKDKHARRQIKSDWGVLFSELNEKYRVAGNVDTFNTPALKMCLSFGLKNYGYRLDPKV